MLKYACCYCSGDTDAAPKEIKITDQVEFLSLKRYAAEWADEIIDHLKDTTSRVSNTDSVVKHGYSMEHIADKLVALYCDVSGKREI